MAIVICVTALILATIFSTNVAGEDRFQDKNRKCVPAEDEPTLNSSSCYPLVNFTRPFCQNNGITLPNYVFKTPQEQIKANNHFNQYDPIRNMGTPAISKLLDVNESLVRRCISALEILACRGSFAPCDGTQNVFKEQKLCRESCLELARICGEIYEMVKTFVSYHFMGDSKNEKLYNCELQPYRNAGDSPECWYYNKFASFTDRSPTSESNIFTDCLHENGSSYLGNISVTASGIPCQSWTEQCPHRHTMNTTYPELNHAKNYCRNPQNSGKRPWCFTTDRNKRWEYCDIPKCTPVNGNYGNWTQQSKCNMSCGQGFELWIRECNNPEPKYGGKNCSHLGEAFEYRSCFEKNCPVNGGYGNWRLSTSCSVSCGVGIEMWRRSCDNPQPKYGGRNCSGLGNSIELRKCTRKPCPIDGSYGNWTRSSCSTTCGKGVETWKRRCDNPPGKYGGNCSKHGPAEKLQICVMPPCPVSFSSWMIGIMTGSGIFLLIIAITAFLFILRRRHRKQGYPMHDLSKLFSRALPSSQPEPNVTSSSQGYENLTINDPVLPLRDSTGGKMGNSDENYDHIQRPPTAVVLPSKCENVPKTEIA